MRIFLAVLLAAAVSPFCARADDFQKDDFQKKADGLRLAKPGFVIAVDAGDGSSAVKFPGVITSAKGRICTVGSPSLDDGYYKAIADLPREERPVVLYNAELLNADGAPVASISAPASVGARESVRTIRFSSGAEANIVWDDKACVETGFAKLVQKYAHCGLCPYAVMLADEISLLFDYVFKALGWTIVGFLAVFGSLYVAQRFWEGAKGWPFGDNFQGFFGDVGEKLRVVAIAGCLALVPPRYIFAWTFEPVIELSMGVARAIEEGRGDNFSCDAEAAINAVMAQRQEREDEKVIPPIVRRARVQARASGEAAKGAANAAAALSMANGAANAAAAGFGAGIGAAAGFGADPADAANGGFGADESDPLADESYFISKKTLGEIVCFISSTQKAGARYLALAQVLAGDVFSWPPMFHSLAGIMIWAMVFGIMMFIAFHVLDGFLKILEIAILWPFMVFGYAFEGMSFKMDLVIDTAKNFGFTVIGLALFSMFSNVLLDAFQFGSSGTLEALLSEAERTGDINALRDTVAGDILLLSRFMFIVFALFYIYSKLSSWVKEYTGGSVGDKPFGNAVRTSLFSLVKFLNPLNIVREPAGFEKNPAPRKKDPPDGGAPARGGGA
ncbi:MAG: hypothetical protein LBH41_00500 [Rickettsiales bacterium]|jgi:hypothetical protein|nr:hypothetical protein [Rickettsiales bacterium]